VDRGATTLLDSFDDVAVTAEYTGPTWRQSMKTTILLILACASVCCVRAMDAPAERPPAAAKTLRVAAAQTGRRLIDWHVREAAAVLAQVEKELGELESIVERAAARGCDIIVFPEDTLGLGTWLAGNGPLAKELLPKAVESMLSRFGKAAARHRMYLVACSNHLENDGAIYNTSFFLGRDGKEIGRYHKVCPTIHERTCKPGDRFPVFNTPDLGDVGLLICYDMVFPEPARCLALGGADVIFVSTLGGAAIGDDEISRAAFRTRAVENFVYLVIAERGSGTMIISPQGKVLAEASGADALAVADIDPFGGREGGDSMNLQRDMRARLFRERTPAAFRILSEANPPVLAKVPAAITEEEAVRIANRALTTGEEEFKAADALARAGKTSDAIRAFERLRKEYPGAWIDRVAEERLKKLAKNTEASR
jgi:predicted amidohydrolase